MYKYDHYDQAMVDARVAEFRDQVLGEFLNGFGTDSVLHKPQDIDCQLVI